MADRGAVDQSDVPAAGWGNNPSVPAEDDESSLRLSARTVAAHLGGCVLVGAGIWGADRTSGIAHVALLVVTGLIFVYLLYLAVIWLFVIAAAAAIDRLARPKRSGRRVPRAWWVVIGWWALGVVSATLITWVGLGARGEEALWLIGSYVVGGLVVAAVFGKVGWDERSAAAKRPQGSGRHSDS